MPTVITHGVVALLLGRAYAGSKMPVRFWVLSVFCSILPDLDAVGFRLGIRYGDVFGHRGFSHSILFALIVGFLISTVFFRTNKIFSRGWLLLALYFSAINVLHGVLDAMTDGGLGVAFFSPFSNERYFLPFRPISVAPIGVTMLFSRWGLSVLASEILWVLLPLWLLCGGVRLARRLLLKRRRHEAGIPPGAKP